MPNTSNSANPPRIKIEKSRTVKRNYQRRQQGFRFSSQQLRQIERNEELKKRADKIKEREKRKKTNKQKKDEKERKAKEERQRLGLPEPGVKLDPDQQRLSQLFGFARKNTVGQDESAQDNSRTEDASDCDSVQCEDQDDIDNCPPANPLDPIEIYEDPDAVEESEMSDDGEGGINNSPSLLEVEVNQSPSTLAGPILNTAKATDLATVRLPDHATGQPIAFDGPTTPNLSIKTTSETPSGILGLENWEVYVDSDADIEQDLANDKDIPTFSISADKAQVLGSNPNPASTTSPAHKILTPRAPSSKLNTSTEDSAAQVIAMISTQDLASDKENLNPSQPSPGEKSPDYEVELSGSSNKAKRSHKEAFVNDDDENKENTCPQSK